MKVRELRQKLAKFNDDLPVVFCTGEGGQVKIILNHVDIRTDDALIRRDESGTTYCIFGKTPISEKYVFVDVVSVDS
jgi:hypothetical protein